MQVQISGHQVDVTPALRSHVESKTDRIARHFDNLTSLTVVLTVEKLLHRAEGTLGAAGKVLHAEATEADMYAAIDVMMDKLDSQVRKYKEKVTNHHQAEAREARYG